MTRPGVNVTSLATPSTTESFTDTGTFFLSGVSERGRTGARLVRSFTEFTTEFGDRVSYGSMWDAADMYFRHGGSRLFLSRQVGPSPTLATLTLSDKAGSPLSTLRVDAMSYGAWGARIKIAVTSGVASDTFVLTVSFDDIVRETSPDLLTPAEAAAWAQFSNYVRVTDLASVTVAPNNNPANRAAAALVGGTDAHTSIAAAHILASLNAFDRDFGPGQVSVTGDTTTATHLQLQAHAEANNRVALLDAPNSGTAATLKAAAAAVRSVTVNSEYAAMFGTWLVVPGIPGATARTVAPSAIVAGMIARQDALVGPNKPAAGAAGISAVALDVANSFGAVDRESLNSSGVNLFRSILGTVRLYGYRTLAITPSGWVQLSNQRLRMLITARALVIGEDFPFDEIDGRGRKLAEFRGALSGMLQDYFLDGSLYGDRPEEAYAVDVASVNTPTTIANGELHARVLLRMSPFAELVDILIVKVPVTDSVA